MFIFGILLVLMASGLPVGFAFMMSNIIGTYFFWGGDPGLNQLILNVYSAVTNFALLPVPLFFLMGEIMFRSGLGTLIIDALDKWLGAIAGRLSLVAVAAGTLLSVVTGVPMASVALMGRTLLPEMQKRGYHKTISLGPILGSGGLATLIPPSSLGVLLAALAEVSVSKVLIGGIVPGLVLGGLFLLYVIVRCRLQPSLAPIYETQHVAFREKMGDFVRYILPLALVVFLVIGVMILGIGTPTEAAATGVVGCAVLAVFNRKLGWTVAKEALLSSAKLTVMVFMIVAGSTAFSQMLAFSQATKGLVHVSTGLEVSPLLLVVAMQVVLMFLGCFMDAFSMMMISIPIFFPIIKALGMDPLWFALLMLLNIEVAPITPPFGLELFVIKGVSPPGITIKDIYWSAFPFIVIDVCVLTIMLFFPGFSLWLPGLM